MEDIVKRRLVLAKEFYENATIMANRTDALGKMMAVHNFHISIEIVLKAIALKYEIRSDKTLNIDFETMLNDIDKHQEFMARGLKIPYRQDLRMLNQKRNMVQHHVVEPERSAMDDWKSISRRFLERSYKDYFEVDFNDVDRLWFINDTRLKLILEKAEQDIKDELIESASCNLAAVFKYIQKSIAVFVPRSSASFFATSSINQIGYGDLKQSFNKIFNRIDETELFAVILALGISIADYSRLIKTLPTVIILVDGIINFQGWSSNDFEKEEINWAFNFLCGFIIRLQSDGLNPSVPEYLCYGADILLKET